MLHTDLLSDDDNNMTMPINAGDMPTGVDALQNDGGDKVKMKMKTVIMNPVPVEMKKTPTTRMTTTPTPIRLMVSSNEESLDESLPALISTEILWSMEMQEWTIHHQQTSSCGCMTQAMMITMKSMCRSQEWKTTTTT